jgi:hypothetical protein
MSAADRLSHYVGLDLGRQADPSSICVLEKADPDPNDRSSDGLPRHAVRYLAQFHLGTSYSKVKAQMAQMMEQRKLRHPLLVADNTGVGSPVVDDLRAADVPLLPVTITGGEAAAARGTDGVWRVPKKHLVGGLQVVLYDKRLAVHPQLPGAGVLQRQLRDLQMKITKAGNETFEARSGAKDDLAVALMLALWAAERACGALPTEPPEAAYTEISRAPEGVFWS